MYLHQYIKSEPLMTKFSSLQVCLGFIICSSLAVSATAKETLTSQRSEAQVSAWLEKHRNQPPAMRAFLQRMPKGGDIHSHLSGAVYAENYLKWAAADGYCVDPVAKTLIEPSACGQNSKYFPASELFNRTATYDALVDQFSTRNLGFAKKSGHDQFFSAVAVRV